MKTYKDYYGSHMTPFERFNLVGGCDPMRILPELMGRPWDDIALGFCHAFNPTSIRVTTGDVKCDSRLGRITVYITEQNII